MPDNQLSGKVDKKLLMRCRNPVVDRHRAQARKIAQVVLQRTLSTPARVDSLCMEELEDLQDSEVELRHQLSLSPRRRQLRLSRFARRGVSSVQVVL